MKKPLDIFDKLDLDLSKKKGKEATDKVGTDILIKKFNDLQDSIYKEFFKSDFDKLEKIITKHTTSIKDVRISNNFGYFEVEKGGWEKNSVQIEIYVTYIKEEGFFPGLLKIEELKRYNFKKEDFGLRVIDLGNINWNLTTNMADIRNTIEEKVFTIKKKDEAYKYFNKLLKKRILNRI